MKKSLIRPGVDPESDVERIAALKRLFFRISRVLEQMIAATEADNEYPPQVTCNKIGRTSVGAFRRSESTGGIS